MKLRKTLLVTALLLSLAALTVRLTFKSHPVVTLARKATHQITYFVKDENGEEQFEGLCTATAIGPHALITANHCDEGKIRTIHLDYTLNTYHILYGITDTHDHTIYLIDGPALKNYIRLQPRLPRLGERVTSYGCGGKDFPPHTYAGRVITDDNGGDYSDIDAAWSTFAFSLPAIPGDSGALIYGEDGNVVGEITYGSLFNDGTRAAVSFALNFNPALYDRVYNLEIVPEE